MVVWSVRAGGMDRTSCWITLLQTARRAAVLGQPSSLRLHWLKLSIPLYWCTVFFPLTDQTQMGWINTPLTACKTLPLHLRQANMNRSTVKLSLLLLFIFSVRFRAMKMKMFKDTVEARFLYSYTYSKQRRKGPLRLFTLLPFPWYYAENIEWFIEGQAPPPPPGSSNDDSEEDWKREACSWLTGQRADGVGEEPNHTTTRMPGPL